MIDWTQPIETVDGRAADLHPDYELPYVDLYAVVRVEGVIMGCYYYDSGKPYTSIYPPIRNANIVEIVEDWRL